MSHLLTLPLEVRTLIYDFYLEGFMLEVREKARSIWQATFVREFEIEDNVLSLRLACRQVYAELAPRVAAQTQLHLTTTYSDRSRRSDAFHPFALLPREFLCKIRTLHVPYYLPHRSPLVYNRALATLPGLEVVTYDGLHLEISEALDNLPAHDLDWTTSTLHSITNLIKPSKALAYLKTKLKIRLQDIWVNDGPVSFYREASVSIGTLGGRGGDESLWESTVTKRVDGKMEAFIRETEELLDLVEKERHGVTEFRGILCYCADCTHAHDAMAAAN